MKTPPVERKGQIIIWTDELDAYVKFHLDKKKSYTWISDQLGITRNSVIGRQYRLRGGDKDGYRAKVFRRVVPR